jgi:DNA-binding MltR family transcriptional regulator
MAKIKIDNLFNEQFDQVIEFRHSLNDETDRGCALMSAAFLEKTIEDELKKVFVKDKGITKSVFDFNGALGTFSAKIQIIYLLGYIDKITYNDLQMIRKIRNEFAHTSKVLRFDDSKIASMILNLQSYLVNNEMTKRTVFIRASLGVLASINCISIKNKEIIELESKLPILEKRIEIGNEIEEEVEKVFAKTVEGEINISDKEVIKNNKQIILNALMKIE